MKFNSNTIVEVAQPNSLTADEPATVPPQSTEVTGNRDGCIFYQPDVGAMGTRHLLIDGTFLPAQTARASTGASQPMISDQLHVSVSNVPKGAVSTRHGTNRWLSTAVVAALLAGLPTQAHASIFHGETLDKIANALAWIVLVVAPAVGIAVFWLVHILPEKIAEKKKHPQAKAIQCLCLLSLVFGGMLWPIAWLWAYSKPVLHKLAYGTDVAEELEHEQEEIVATEKEVAQLRAKLARLEARLPGNGPAGEGKA